MTEIRNSLIKSIEVKIRKAKAYIVREKFRSGMMAENPLPSVEMARKTAEAQVVRKTVTLINPENGSKMTELNTKLDQLRNDISEIRRNEKSSDSRKNQWVRTLDERFERGEMFRILKKIWKKRTHAAPGDKKAWDERMQAAREISRNLGRDLDILNNQYYDPKNLQKVPVKLDGEDYQIPVRHYSLKEVGGPQKEPPLVVLGGAIAGHKVTKSTVEAFALQYPGRDIYVISYPDNSASIIPPSFPEKIKGPDAPDVYIRLLTGAIEKLGGEQGFEQFDLVGISMGGGIGVGMGKNKEFAKKIRNLIIVSPTNIQPTRNKYLFGAKYGLEYLHGITHPKEFLRIGRLQPGHELETHKGTGWLASMNIVTKNVFKSDDLTQIEVGGRVILLTGEKDQIISSQQTLEEAEKANKKREKEGKRKIEARGIRGGHHNLGDAFAAGWVALIRHSDVLPEQIFVSQLENSTAKVLVREDPRLASVVDQIIGGRT